WSGSLAQEEHEIGTVLVPIEQLVAGVVGPRRQVGDGAAVGGEHLQHLARRQGLHLAVGLHHRHGAQLAAAVEELVLLDRGHQMNRVMCDLRASDRQAPAPPNSTPSMKSLVSKPKTSWVIVHAMRRTPDSRQMSRSSSTLATPFL